MNYVYILQLAHEISENIEDVKFIGAYSSEQKAQEAIERIKTQPGFVDASEGFSIDKYKIDKDHWCEGYTIVT